MIIMVVVFVDFVFFESFIHEILLKEVALTYLSSNKQYHWMIKPPTHSSRVRCDLMNKFNNDTKTVHGIPWDTGYIHQKDVLEYLKNILSVVDTVFVQGSVKEQYISFLMREYPAVNIKNIDQLFLTDSFNRHNNNFTCPYNTKSHKSMYCALERCVRYSEILENNVETEKCEILNLKGN